MSIDVRTGIYDPAKRFQFTNITEKPFTFTWGKAPITVKPKETIELPHYLAVVAKNALIDQIITESVRDEEHEMKKKTNDQRYRSPRGLTLGIPAARQEIEDKIIKELEAKSDTDSQLQVIRARAAEEIVRDLKAENAAPISSLSQVIPASSGNLSEFEGVNVSKGH